MTLQTCVYSLLNVAVKQEELLSDASGHRRFNERFLLLPLPSLLLYLLLLLVLQLLPLSDIGEVYAKVKAVDEFDFFLGVRLLVLFPGIF